MINTWSMDSSGKPQCRAIPFKIPRSLMRTVNALSGQIRPRAVVVARISSISARLVASPKMSMSHCTNWRNRPFWGLSARQTLPICSALKGLGRLAALLA